MYYCWNHIFTIFERKFSHIICTKLSMNPIPKVHLRRCRNFHFKKSKQNQEILKFVSFFSALSNSRFITTVSFIAIVLSNLMSLYFAYILYFILHDFCVVCVSIYIVNIINFILMQLKLKVMSTIEENKQKDQMKKQH